MNPGAKLKYEKVRKIQRNAVEFNSIAYALPPYRALVSATTKAIVPHLEEYIAKESVRTGRPGKNKIALSYLVDLGPEFVVALAVTTTVNNFHRPLSHQSLAMKIGQAIAYEWSIFQEDPTTVARVVKNTHTKVRLPCAAESFCGNNCPAYSSVRSCRFLLLGR